MSGIVSIGGKTAKYYLVEESLHPMYAEGTKPEVQIFPYGSLEAAVRDSYAYPTKDGDGTWDWEVSAYIVKPVTKVEQSKGPYILAADKFDSRDRNRRITVLEKYSSFETAVSKQTQLEKKGFSTTLLGKVEATVRVSSG